MLHRHLYCMSLSFSLLNSLWCRLRSIAQREGMWDCMCCKVNLIRGGIGGKKVNSWERLCSCRGQKQWMNSRWSKTLVTQVSYQFKNEALVQNFPVAEQRRIFHSLHCLSLRSRKKATQCSATPVQTKQTSPRERSKSVGAFGLTGQRCGQETHNMERQADGSEEVVAAQRELVIR